MHFKTSTKLSLTFTLYVCGLLVLLGIFVIVGGMSQTYRAESRKLQFDREPPPMQDTLEQPRRPRQMQAMQRSSLVVVDTDAVFNQKLKT
jgi:hypothetical protein